MNYLESINQSKELDELFSVWKHKEPGAISYMANKQAVTVEINHGRDYFIADGVVNKDVWESGKKKRILFVLKEAYGTDWGNETLVTWLRNYHPVHRMWKRVARWVYGIQNTSTDHMERYVPELSPETHGECLEQIAVLNLKKSGGESGSDYDEINAYAKYDCEEIKREFSLINADIVVCGATFGTLLETVFGESRRDDSTRSDNWYYYLNLDGKERLFLDVYHPANLWPDLMNYYTVTGIYQQALIEKSGR